MQSAANVMCRTRMISDVIEEKNGFIVHVTGGYMENVLIKLS